MSSRDKQPYSTSRSTNSGTGGGQHPQYASYSTHPQHSQPSQQGQHAHAHGYSQPQYIQTQRGPSQNYVRSSTVPMGATTAAGQGRVSRAPATDTSGLHAFHSAPAVPGYNPRTNNLPSRSVSVPVQSTQTAAASTQGLKVHFTKEAEKQLEDLERNDPRYRGHAREMHVQAVEDYAKVHKPDAKRANIRKIAHEGGTNSEEEEHQTVSFKGGRGENGHGVHIYMPHGTIKGHTK